MFSLLGLSLCLLAGGGDGVGVKNRPPHIIFIVADDLGWNDVGWNNEDIQTPVLDSLARQGVILNQSYVQPYCSPSRSAFLTGLYPFRMGLQHLVITATSQAGVPLNVTMLPQLLKAQGYATHMIGKWHLGFCKMEYTPTWRGFDSFLGFYGATVTYYERQLSGGTYDFRHNESVNRSFDGVYSTELFGRQAEQIIRAHRAEQPLFLYLAFQAVHAPLQVPEKYLHMYDHVSSTQRRRLSAMVSSLDDAIGRVVRALNSSGLLDNSVIAFTSDNGAPVYFGGSNWPLKGAKGTLWEGGTRVPAFAYSPLFEHSGFRSNALFHATDWFTTLLHLAGGKVSELPYAVDGVDQQAVLSRNVTSVRTEFVYNINEYAGASAIRVGNFKLIVGYPGGWDSHYNNTSLFDPFMTDAISVSSMMENADAASQLWTSWSSNDSRALYDLRSDPLETKNIAAMRPQTARNLLQRLENYKKLLVPYKQWPRDARANWNNWNNIVTPGWCSLPLPGRANKLVLQLPILASALLACLLATTNAI